MVFGMLDLEFTKKSPRKNPFLVNKLLGFYVKIYGQWVMVILGLWKESWCIYLISSN